jgi:hypothetical protein
MAVDPNSIPDKTLISLIKERETFHPAKLWNSEQPQNRDSEYFKNIVGDKRCDFSDNFFNQYNIDLIQQSILYNVKKKTGYIIERQRDIELVQIMKNIFDDQYPNIASRSTEEKISILNNNVIGTSIKIILPAMRQHLGYLRSLSQPKQLNEMPKSDRRFRSDK